MFSSLTNHHPYRKATVESGSDGDKLISSDCEYSLALLFDALAHR